MTRHFVCSVCAVLLCVSASTTCADSFLSRLNPWKDGPQTNTRWMPLDEGRTWRYHTTQFTPYGSVLDDGITTVAVDTLTTFEYIDPVETTAVLLYTGPRMQPVRREYAYYKDSPWKLMDCNGTILYDFTALPGNVTRVCDEKRRTGGHPYRSATTITCLGSENIIVPAGTFNNCRKYQWDSIGYLDKNGDIEIQYQRTETVWFARGIGIVMIDKTVEHIHGNGTKRTVLVLEHTTTE